MRRFHAVRYEKVRHLKICSSFSSKKIHGFTFNKKDFSGTQPKKVLIAFSTNEFHWLHSQRFKQEFLTNGRVCYMGKGYWGVNFLHPKIGSESTHSFFCKMGNIGYCRLKKGR
jgi:hypothetical protein